MKIAYLVSRYPAVSHTFILREIYALRARGLDIESFSIRRAKRADILGPDAQAEAKRTRHLLPPNLLEYVNGLAWALYTRPQPTTRAFCEAIAVPGVSLFQRLMWCFYFAESVVLARWLVQGGFAHLHCHFGNNGSNTALLASIIASIPFSMTLHGIDLDPYEQYRLPRKISLAKFTVCISSFGKDKMTALRPGDAGKIHVVHCGLPQDAVPPPASPTGQGRLLCVARLSEEKGHCVLLDALKALRDEGVVFSCTLVGDGPLRAELESQTARLGLSNCVHFKGALPPEAVSACYAECDAVVLSSFAEGIPLVLMEAMSMERPVVATRVGGIPELVKDGVNGFLVPANDAPALTAALRNVLADPQGAVAMGKSGAQKVREDFSIEVSADRLESLFRS